MTTPISQTIDLIEQDFPFIDINKLEILKLQIRNYCREKGYYTQLNNKEEIQNGDIETNSNGL